MWQETHLFFERDKGKDASGSWPVSSRLLSPEAWRTAAAGHRYQSGSRYPVALRLSHRSSPFLTAWSRSRAGEHQNRGGTGELRSCGCTPKPFRCPRARAGHAAPAKLRPLEQKRRPWASLAPELSAAPGDLSLRDLCFPKCFACHRCSCHRRRTRETPL